MIPAKTISQAKKFPLGEIIEVLGGQSPLNAFGSELLMVCTITVGVVRHKRLPVLALNY
jgi:hypothetical protein